MNIHWEPIEPGVWTCRGLTIKKVYEQGATLFHVKHADKLVATGADLEDAQDKAKEYGGWGAT